MLLADSMQLRRHLVTASYVDRSLSMLDEMAKSAGITILGEMGLDPGIGNCMTDYVVVDFFFFCK